MDWMVGLPYDINADLLPHCHERHLQSCNREILLHGAYNVTPLPQCTAMLAKLHESHQSATKWKPKVCNAIWWSGQLKDIDEHIAACPTYCQHQLHHSELLHLTQCPDLTWHTVGCNLMQYDGKLHLVIINVYLLWCLGVILLHSTSSINIIQHLVILFAMQSIPTCLVSNPTLCPMVGRNESCTPPKLSSRKPLGFLQLQPESIGQSRNPQIHST